MPMDEELDYGVEIYNKLTSQGLGADIYLEQGKFQKKMKYANKLGVPNVIILGEQERVEGKVQLKNMITGEQDNVTIEEAIKLIKK